MFPAFRVERENGAVRGRVLELTLDDLSIGDTVLEVRYSSVNHKDALAVAGIGDIIRTYPRVPGIDVAGVVASSSDCRFTIGTSVVCTNFGMGTDHDGGYAGNCRLPAEWIVPLPNCLTLRQAMVLGTAGLTAALAINDLEVNGLSAKSGPVLVTGATGGVGAILIDVLAHQGYEVTAMTSKGTPGAEFLRNLGAADVIPPPNLERPGKPLESSRWSAAFDSVGGLLLGWVIRHIKPGGLIASFGNAGGNELSGSVLPFILRGVRLIGVNVRHTPIAVRQQLWSRLATTHKPPHLDELASEITLSELPSAAARILKSHNMGRILVRI
jgi:acrylyl-CoA reductase (NADPH)